MSIQRILTASSPPIVAAPNDCVLSEDDLAKHCGDEALNLFSTQPTTESIPVQNLPTTDKIDIWKQRHTPYLFKLSSSKKFRAECLKKNTITTFANKLFEEYGICYLESTILTEVKRLKNTYPKAFMDPENAFSDNIKDAIKLRNSFNPKLTHWNAKSRYYLWILKNDSKPCKYGALQEITDLLSAKFKKKFSANLVSVQLCRLKKMLSSIA